MVPISYALLLVVAALLSVCNLQGELASYKADRGTKKQG